GMPKDVEINKIIRDWMTAVMKLRGWTARQWAIRADVDPTTITRIVRNPEKASTTSMQTLKKLADAAGEPMPMLDATQAGIDTYEKGRREPLPMGPRDLPIRGSGRGGTNGLFMDNGAIQGMVERHAQVHGVPAALACYLTGDSMAARLVACQLRYLHPVKPVRPGPFLLL